MNSKLKELVANEKIRFTAIFVILGLISFLFSQKTEAPEEQAQQKQVEIDELIPEGYFLLPLELTNREALVSMIGDTSIVDIFTIHPQTLNPQKKIASRVKLIKSPKNPDQFALLLKESNTMDILKYSGPYFATIQNRRNRKTSFPKTHNQSNVQVRYQEEL